MSELEISPDETETSVTLPAYEYVKRNILFRWYRIEDEYERYMLLKSTDKTTRTDSIGCKLLSLYATILQPMMNNMKFMPEFINELDKYMRDGYRIPEHKLNEIIRNFANFLNVIDLTDITHKQKSWQDQIRDGYGIF